MEQEPVSNKFDTSQTECFICYETLKFPIKSKCCSNTCCYAHLPGFQDKCPTCRATPFIYEKDEVIEKMVFEQ